MDSIHKNTVDVFKGSRLDFEQGFEFSTEEDLFFLSIGHNNNLCIWKNGIVVYSYKTIFSAVKKVRSLINNSI